jgi:hypothetical protein
MRCIRRHLVCIPKRENPNECQLQQSIRFPIFAIRNLMPRKQVVGSNDPNITLQDFGHVACARR